ncbi:MAG: hypothetical protein MR283_06290 [Erysipelotrichaceae bacterium]|nr:hypothetical protein [Erysipelotrichaceae bacterium]
MPQALLARCSTLVDVTIPEGIETLSEVVFGQDYALRTLYFPKSITQIHPETLAFLTQVTITVEKESYAETFCKEHNYPCIYK